MKKYLRLLGLCAWLVLSTACGAAVAWNGETFSEKWNSSWEKIGQDMDRAGQDLRMTFFPSRD